MGAHINPGWYAANSLRRFPIDDGSSGEPDLDGAGSLPDNLIVDLSLRWPRSRGRYAYLSAVSVTSNLVTLILSASNDRDTVGSFVPIAAVSIAKPVVTGKSYPLKPLADGVVGWIVFGEGVDRNYRATFSAPVQGGFAPRAARPYRDLPVVSIAKEGILPRLKGLVRLHAGTDIRIRTEDREIAGHTRTAVIVSLKETSGKNVFDTYRGPCSGRPETRTCPTSPIETINDVSPDCDGNLRLTFVGEVIESKAETGLVLDYNLGLGSSCYKELPNSSGQLPSERDDACTSEYEGFNPDTQSIGSEMSIGFPETELSLSSGEVVCRELPYSTNFDEGGPDGWTVESGSFAILPRTSATYEEASAYEGDEYYYCPTAPERRCVSVLGDCAEQVSANRTVETTLINVNEGTLQTPTIGGLVLNWRLTGAVLRENYFLVGLNFFRGRAEILHYDGYDFVVIAASDSFPTLQGELYLISCDITQINETTVRLQAEITGLTTDVLSVGVQMTVDVTDYLPATGYFGLGTNMGYTNFGRFTMA